MPFILAAGSTPAFFSEVALLLVASAAIAYLGFRLKLMPIVSFLVTGALIGPHALGLVHDEALIEAAAEVGVVLLLFTIGIEFSLDKLARIKKLIFVGGGVQVGLVIALVAGGLALFGVGWRAGVFTGFLVALSSTAIVMKLLMDRGQTNQEGGQAGLGVLIFQDLAVVAMVLLVPVLGGDGGSTGSLLLALGKAVAIVVLVLVVARRFMPLVLEAVARTCSQEIFLLAVVAICFGTAWLTSLAGVSLSLGAFLAGLMVSESRFSEMAFGEILPLQILFSATFFVSVGLLLDLGFLVANLPLVLGVIAVVLLIKLLATVVSLKVLGYGTGTLAFTSLLLAQVGEFSFVLERTGRDAGLFPAGLADGGPQTFIAATVVLMIATPFLADLGERIRRRHAAPSVPDADAAPAHTPHDGHGGLHDHVVIAGYGEAGRALAHTLHRRNVPYVILTLSPTGATDAEDGDLHVLRGNYTRQHELTLAGTPHARLLVVADDDLETTRRVVNAAHSLNPDLRVLACTRYNSEVDELREAGATDVVTEENEAVARIIRDVLGVYDQDDAPLPTDTPMVELSPRQRASRKCSHTADPHAVTPRTDGCAECLKLGDTWVHLRVCMTCGHVGCCDSSKNKHATAHHLATGHPIVKSLEPGENWAWCYEDDVVL